MKRKIGLIALISYLIINTISAYAVEVPSLHLSDGGDNVWHKYNIVYGNTTWGPSGRATVRCVLTVVNGGYTIVSNKVQVNIGYATVKLGPTLLYKQSGMIYNKGISNTVPYYTDLSRTEYVNNQNEYQVDNTITYYGAQQINSVSYAQYGGWNSKNYNSHHM
jgi:hypothetical protein